MRIYDIIKKKRDGFSLTTEEIDYFVQAYTEDKIPDYQISALLMAIYLNKMDRRETFDLTNSVINSGDTYDLSNIKGIKVDKHSTGGVGDTTTLILGPMVAACGVPFVKMSGRGLGHTGGTLDKLESIKGFRVELQNKEFVDIVNDINIAIISQAGNITPADKKLYALRDVTATVDDLSLIAASIMSKKLAIKSDAIILDVKVGSGAFMKSLDEAIELANEMVSIGNSFGRKTIALVTDMDQPLGDAVGNILEIKEAIETLKGNGPSDIYELCLALGSKLLVLAGKTEDENQARKMLIEAVESGKAYDKFHEMVNHQGGDTCVLDNPELFPKAKYIIEVKAEESGYVKSINAEKIGLCSLILGAGRENKDSKLDLTVGLVLNKKIDDKVEKDQVLAYIHANSIEKSKEVEKILKDSIAIGDKNTKKQKLIYKIIED